MGCKKYPEITGWPGATAPGEISPEAGENGLML